MSKIVYPPRRLFLDDFVADVRRRGGWTPRICALTGADLIRQHPEAAVFRRANGVMLGLKALDEGKVRLSSRTHDAITEQLAYLRTARVTRITRPVQDMVMETAHRIVQAGYSQSKLFALPLDPLPAVPQWIEFETAMGDEHFPIAALWLDSVAHHTQLTPKARAIGAPPGSVACQFVQSAWENKELWLHTGGGWSTHQTGRCSYEPCHIARDTQEGITYTLDSEGTRQVVYEQASQPEGKAVMCQCYSSGWEWTIILNVLFSYLRYEHAVYETTPYQVAEPPAKRSQRELLRAAVADWNTVRPPVYRTVSLGHPASARTRRLTRAALAQDQTTPAPQPADDDTASAPAASGEETVTYQREVGMHPRFLVPAPGLPWKRPQVVLVRAHVRAYAVRPGTRQVRVVAER